MSLYGMFSNSVMIDMITVYCQEFYKGGAAARRYRALYPSLENFFKDRKNTEVLNQSVT